MDYLQDSQKKRCLDEIAKCYRDTFHNLPQQPAAIDGATMGELDWYIELMELGYDPVQEA